MITNPRQTIGTVHTSIGSAQLLHCYKHPLNVAIALLVAPMSHPEMTEHEWDEEWDDIKHIFSMTAVEDKAKLLRMLSSMGLCSECVQDAMKTGLPWSRFVYILQTVKNYQTNEEISFGAYKEFIPEKYPTGIHTLGKPIELSFVGQTKSTVSYFCPTCLHASFSNRTTITIKGLSDLLNIPQDGFGTNVLAYALRNIGPPLSKVIR